MQIRIADPSAPRSAEITPRAVYENRRAILRSLGLGLGLGLAGSPVTPAIAQDAKARKLATRPGAVPPVMDKPTPYKLVTTYNNFYEFGLDKSDPAANAHSLVTRPWHVAVEGEVERPRSFDIEDILKLAPLEERVYRFRCVEAWSMVIPWVGYPLARLLEQVRPTSRARFVEFETLADPKQMPGLSSGVLKWPYVEGLRIDEAMHPLTLLGLGLYGEELPRQNGAPVRIVVPWKYGFKSAKSIVRIRLVDRQPISSWNRAAPFEYGFYSNVNPDVDHPRWSQATERRIGEDGFLQRKRQTLMFNGYADQVASLYTGLDLRRNF